MRLWRSTIRPTRILFWWNVLSIKYFPIWLNKSVIWPLGPCCSYHLMYLSIFDHRRHRMICSQLGRRTDRAGIPHSSSRRWLGYTFEVGDKTCQRTCLRSDVVITPVVKRHQRVPEWRRRMLERMERCVVWLTSRVSKWCYTCSGNTLMDIFTVVLRV